MGLPSWFPSIYTGTAHRSPYSIQSSPNSPQATLHLDGRAIAPISFPRPPQFYSLTTAEGIPYWKIALLHSQDVLATTVLQTCMRYRNPATACQFCAIEQSLAADRTIARKAPSNWQKWPRPQCNWMG
jgi:biotin synthase-related radical SAM superfamily protein